MIFTKSLLCAECAKSEPLAQLNTKASEGFCDSCLKVGVAYRASLKAPAGARKEIFNGLNGVWTSQYCSLEDNTGVNKIELSLNLQLIEAAAAPLRALNLKRDVMVDIKDLIVLAFYSNGEIVSPSYHQIESATYQVGGALDGFILIVTSSKYDSEDRMEIVVEA